MSTPPSEMRRLIKEIVRSEVTSGDITKQELTNTIIEGILTKLQVASELFMGVYDLTVAVDEVLHVPSSSELGVKSLTIDGVLRNDGKVVIRETLTVNGTLINNGAIEQGW